MIDEDFQLHGKCFNKMEEKYGGSQTLQGPSSTMNAKKKNDQFFSRVRKDLEIDLNHGSSRPKDVVVKSRIGSTQGIKAQRSPTNGSRFNTLGSKLEQLRNEIKR